MNLKQLYLLPLILAAALSHATSSYSVLDNSTTTGSIQLNGVDQYVTFEADLDLQDTFTISTWVNISKVEVETANRTLLSKANPTDGWSIGLNKNNQITITNYVAGEKETVISNTYLSNDIWSELSVSFDGTLLHIYIDGILDKSTPFSGLSSSNAPLILGALSTATSSFQSHFKGKLDEVRIWNQELHIEQIRFLMNQELMEANGQTTGKVIPTTYNIALPLWNTLLAYYDFNTSTNTAITDRSAQLQHSNADNSSFEIMSQEAPLPYLSISNGTWDDTTIWNGGTAVHLPNSHRVVDGFKTIVDWNIVLLAHDIELKESVTVLGLVQQQNKVEVTNNKSLTITAYLKIDGTLDLIGESQLLQTPGSVLETASIGKLQRDQQGTGSKFNYNYWSSPVSYSPQDPTVDYEVRTVMHDGTNTNNPMALNFTGSENPDGAPARNNQAATVSEKWIYKYSNLSSGDYSNWQFVGKSGGLKAGEGYSMKGTGSSNEQNYTFIGLPNNGDIELNANEGNDYLIGNPYPSAMDAYKFIQDNPGLDGTLYYWEHLGGESHDRGSYEGGYSMFNLSGGTPNATIGTSNALQNINGEESKIPGRFIPVAQGFFVIVKDDMTINFHNSQRVFEKENNGRSVFVAAPGSNPNRSQSVYEGQMDDRSKIRIGFDSPNLIHRQILLTVDPNATAGYDRGYDGIQFDDQVDDMAFWMNNERLSIQGVGTVDDSIELPLYIKLKDHGTIKIGLDYIENLDDDQAVYLKDSKTGILHNLRDSKFESPFLFRGQYKTRFSIVFHGKSTLSNTSMEDGDGILVFTPATNATVNIKTPGSLLLEEVTLTNMLGQQVLQQKITNPTRDIVIDRNTIATGNYIVTMKSKEATYTRKIILQ